MASRPTVGPNPLKGDKQSAGQVGPDDESSIASDIYSSFEDDGEDESGSKKTSNCNQEGDKKTSQEAHYRREHNGVVIYDSAARTPKYHSMPNSHSGDKQGSETLDSIVYPLRKCISPTYPVEDGIPELGAGNGHNPQSNDSGTQCGTGTADGVDSFIHRALPSFFATRCSVPEYTLIRPTYSDGIEFTSKFENGNLRKAIRVSRLEYELLLAEDFNTQGHYHWFFFRTSSSVPAGTRVHFRILNLIKPRSLYTMGYKPFVYSVKRQKATSKKHLLI
jgi:hypothetical protein